MAKPWGGAGAWAAEAERADLEREKERVITSSTDFPDLTTAVQQQKGGKKKKQQSMSLNEFQTGVAFGARNRQISDSRGLTPLEQRMLPTGPRDRSGEETESGLGGGFRDYGGGGFRGLSERGGQESGRSSFGGGFDREERGGGFGRDSSLREEGPSRADENENWGAAKKFVPSLGGGGGQGGGYGDDDRRGSRLSDRDLPSRADEVDNWGLSKKFVPSLESRPSFRSDDGRSDLSSRADEVDNWGAAKKFVPTLPALEKRGGFDYREAGVEADRWSRREVGRDSFESVRSSERPRLVLQPRTRPVDSSPPPPLPLSLSQVVEREGSGREKKAAGSVSGEDVDVELPPKPKPKLNPFGSARPREDVLAEKGLDWKRLEVEREVSSRPSSSHSSRPQTPEVAPDGTLRTRHKINPFGDAKPREVLLEEKGKNWRKIDFELEHRSVERSETPEEQRLKEEIKVLEELAKSGNQVSSDNGVVTSDEKRSVQEQLEIKEKELERLTRDLDDKVRFSQRGDRSLRSGRSDRSVSRERMVGFNKNNFS